MSSNITNAYGVNAPFVSVFPLPINTNRDPGAQDFAEVGQIWVNYETNVIWMAVNAIGEDAVWNRVENAGGAGVFTDLTATGTILLDSTSVNDVNIISETRSVNIIGREAAVDAVSIAAPNGGISLGSTGSIGLASTNGRISLLTNQNNANAILITTAAGNNETINIQSQLGNNPASVNINSVHGGITIASNTTDGTDGILIEGNTGGVKIESTKDGADSILIQTNAGNTETLSLASLVGTGPNSIDIVSSHGGINIQANLIDGTSGIKLIGSTGPTAISGISASMVATTSVDPNSIAIGSVHGGITIASNITDGTDGIVIDGKTGPVLISSNENADGAISLGTAGGTASVITALNTLGTGADSIRLNSLLGGVTVKSSAPAAATGFFLEQDSVPAAIQVAALGAGMSPTTNAPIGSLFINTTGGAGFRLFANTNGTNGWVSLSAS